MIKLIQLLKRKGGLTQEEFSQYWEEIHGPLAAKMIPKLRKYVHNYPIRLSKGGEPPIDGIAELWFNDLESWRESVNWYRSDEGKVIREDEDKFIDKSKLVVFVAEEKVVK